jgi:CHAT domain-containing protein
MISLKKLRDLGLYLTMLAGLVSAGQAPTTTPTIDEARRAASVAEASVVTLEAREAALKQLQEAVRLFLLANDTVEAAQILNRVGRLQLVLNDPLAAIESHKRALALLDQTPSDRIRVDSLNGLAAVYMRRYEEDEAEKALRPALQLSRQSGYAAGEARSLLILSEQQNYHDHVLALQTAQQALSLWTKLDDKAGMAGTYAEMGEIYLAQNLLAEATQNYDMARQLWRELNNPGEQAGALIGLGFVEYRRGEWQRAIKFHTEAQGLIDDRAEPTRAGQIEVGLAESLSDSGLPEEGLPHYQRALQYYRSIGKPDYVAYVEYAIGCTQYLLGNYTEAIAQFEQTLGKVNGDSLQAAQAHEYLGRVYVAKHESALALQHLQIALPAYVRAHNPREAGQAIALMGQAYQQQGRLEKAKRLYEEALTTFRTLSDRINESATLYALGSLELKQNNLDKAEDRLRESIDVTENVRRVSTSSDLTVAFSASVHDRYTTYIECLMRKGQTKPQQDLAVTAFQTSELAKARSLAELLRSTQTNLAPGLDPQLAQREKSLRQSLRIKEDARVTLLSREYKQEELVALNAEIARLETEYKEVNETIRTQYPAYEQMNQPKAWTLRQIQEQVIADDQTVLLEYSLGADKSYVWAITRNGVTSYELPPRAQITAAAQTVYQLLKDEPRTDDDANGLARDLEVLGRMVLSPVAAELNKQRIIIVADGALNYIPFQILPSPSAINQPLVSSYEVVNTPSASILGQLQQEAAHRQTPAHVLAAFGDPVFASNYAQRKETDDGKPALSAQWQHAVRDIEPSGDSFDPSTLEPLFFTKRELANLREVAGAETFVATGFEASREKLESADLTKYAILHFATHGILDPKRPEKSGIVLSMVDRDGQPLDGFVGLQDIYSLQAPVSLVVLSACRTGLGKEVRGEGLIGLTRGFMYAGASSVMASLWKVDDKATAELMKRFYANMLQHGMTPAAALRSAQNSIRQEPQWRAPYYWAAFTMQGEYRQVIKPTPSKAGPPYVLIFAGAALMLLVAVVWQYRRLRGIRTT